MKWPWNRNSKAKETAKSDYDAVHMAVYCALNQRLLRQYNDGYVWLSGNYDPNYWKPVFDKAQSEIDAVRSWAKTLEDVEIRDHYIEWLTYYYQYGLDDAREEIRTQKKRREMNDFQTRNALIQIKMLNITVPIVPASK